MKAAKVVWTYKAQRNAPIRSSAAVSEDLVIFGSRDKLVTALRAKDGQKAWSFATRSRVDGSPVVVGERVFIGSADGRLYALDRETGHKLWDYEAGGRFTSSPAVARGKLVIGNEDGTLYCFGSKQP